MEESHESVRQLLGPYALSALDENDCAMVEDHLATCAVCRGEVVKLQAAVTTKALPEPPPALWQRILAEVRRRPKHRQTGSNSAFGTARG